MCVAFNRCSDIGLRSYGSRKRLFKDGWIVLVVIPIAELGDILMQVAKRDFVILADDTPLQEAPNPSIELV